MFPSIIGLAAWLTLLPAPKLSPPPVDPEEDLPLPTVNHRPSDHPLDWLFPEYSSDLGPDTPTDLDVLRALSKSSAPSSLIVSEMDQGHLSQLSYVCERMDDVDNFISCYSCETFSVSRSIRWRCIKQPDETMGWNTQIGPQPIEVIIDKSRRASADSMEQGLKLIQYADRHKSPIRFESIFGFRRVVPAQNVLDMIKPLRHQTHSLLDLSIEQ